jgi:hypothetical protein
VDQRSIYGFGALSDMGGSMHNDCVAKLALRNSKCNILADSIRWIVHSSGVTAMITSQAISLRRAASETSHL